MARLYCPGPLAAGESLQLPATATRHAQVLRLQPGDAITLFNGEGGEFEARVERIGRSDVRVQVERHHAVEREAARAVHLVVGMPANERMDWLVEKATEVGAASIQPVLCERSVLQVKGDRAARKQAHWQAIAVAACEQCGRNRVPPVHDVLGFGVWLDAARATHMDAARLLLSLSPQARPLPAAGPGSGVACLLSGPEGGFGASEEAAALAAGYSPVTLGPRVLRAETAPLVALSLLAGG